VTLISAKLFSAHRVQEYNFAVHCVTSTGYLKVFIPTALAGRKEEDGGMGKIMGDFMGETVGGEIA